MVRTSRGLAVALAALVAPLARSNPQTGPRDSVLTMRRALEAAEAHAPRLKARASDVGGAQDAVALSDEPLYPSLDVGLQAVRATDNNVTGLFFPQSMIPPVSGPVRANASGTAIFGSAYGVAASWAPITFGRVGSQRRQARDALTLARDNLASARFDEQGQVAAAYLDLLAARELVRVQQQALARTEAAARATRTLAASGLRPGADSLLAIADVARARVDVLAAGRNAASVGSRLAELLGTAGALPALDGRPFLDTIPDLETAPRDVLVDLSRHPHLLPFAAQVAVSDARQAVAARAALPRLSFMAVLSARGSGIGPDGSLDRSVSAGLSPLRSNSAVGIMASMPILDAVFTGPRSGIERERAEADRFELAAEEDRVRAQVAAADTNLDLAVAAAREVPAQLAAATAGYRQMNSRYSSGLATVADLAQAQYLLNRAEADVVLTRIAAWRAWLDQCTARGNLAPFLARIR